MHVSFPAALLAALAPASSSGDPRTLEAVPANAMCVLSIPPLDDLRERGRANAWFQLWNSEEFAPFVAKVGELVDEALAQKLADESEAARRIADPRAWLAAMHGSVSAFFVPCTPFAEGDALGGWIIEMREERAELDQLLDSLVDVLREDATESTLEYEGVDLRLFESHDESTLTITFESNGVFALLVGDRREEVIELGQGTLDRLRGEDAEGDFASSDRLAEARAAGGSTRGLELFLDLGELIRFLEAMEAAADPFADANEAVAEPVLDPLVQRLGLYDVRWLHATGDIGAGEEVELRATLHLPEESLLQGASAFLGPAAHELFAVAPADSLAAAVWNLDVAGLWGFVLGAVQELNPEAHETFRAGLEQLDVGMGIDVEGDLIDQFTGDLATFTMRIPEEEVSVSFVETFGDDARKLFSHADSFLVGLENGVAVEDLVESIIETAGMGAMIQAEDFQGHHVQSVEMAGTSLHWCFTDRFFVSSGSPTAVRTALSRLGAKDSPSILADARYRAALEKLESASYVSLSDSRVNVEISLRALGTVMEMLPEEMGLKLALSEHLLPLLPDPAIAKRHLEGVTIIALEVSSDHAQMRWRAR